eukprot:3984188-Pleurochrysis_carterae.AAC.1
MALPVITSDQFDPASNACPVLFSADCVFDNHELHGYASCYIRRARHNQTLPPPLAATFVAIDSF